ncbi:sulfate adenylyltransferase subunit CysN [Marivibrio halodurans]|uniref:Multifunctional fusion protein n=1 Tax=Marivibrio halodurans TaxID=2039722 RepID=A0A8J7S0V7_9PROT|nr:sulfate adenylyltransferase subunit CysN [Marivibrio halodurans]MBP5857845.1 sulfate adenylyltransferase subunit CysN [Marivibrio halodurans]
MDDPALQAIAEAQSPEEVARFLEEQEKKDLLRFITCGSVDDGKSTLIGRLLFDSKLIFDDQMAALEKDSRNAGTVRDGLDLALLVDGLQAEREQGITIDVAYRFFATDKRKFIVADTPGHEQYTRNMATGASTAEAAVILIDARKGVLTQTKRHSFIASLTGIRHVILAVNKMDLVGYERETFESIVATYRTFAEGLDFESVTAIPISALEGANVLRRGAEETPWYEGPTLVEVLETLQVARDWSALPFRMPVQYVNRPDRDFRGYCGTIVGGTVKPGDAVTVLPSGKSSRVARVVAFGGDPAEAVAGQAVTLTLEDEIDISRGDLIAASDQPAQVSDQFACHILWMDEAAMLPERQYLFKFGGQSVNGAVTSLKHQINVNTMEHSSAKTLGLNQVGYCNIALDRAIGYDPYQDNRETGAFIIIDRYSNRTIGAGMIAFGLRRATNLHWQALDVDKTSRAAAKGQSPGVLWFTGLSGAGKSTVANLVEKKLMSLGRHTYLLDGDNVRHGLNRDLGFTDAERVENIRRVGETAKLFVDAGLIVLVSFISPFRSERAMARALVEEGEFIEIHVDTPLEICEQRDPKGLYRKARSGAIKNFTGIDSPYEPPESPEIRLDTGTLSAEDAAELVVAKLRERGLID